VSRAEKIAARCFAHARQPAMFFVGRCVKGRTTQLRPAHHRDLLEAPGEQRFRLAAHAFVPGSASSAG